MTEIEQQLNSHILIMNQLNGMDKNLAINTTETTNIKNSLGKIEVDVKEGVTEARKTNGRITKLEDWSTGAQKIIETTSEIADNYKTDKARLWTAITIIIGLWGLLTIVGAFTFKYFVNKTVNDALSTYQE